MLENKGQQNNGDIENFEQNPLDLIPTQYRGLPAEVLEDIWTPPIYTDPVKNREVHENRKKAIEALKQAEAKYVVKPESVEDPYATFKVKNGETQEGFTWYEYRNRIAKEMKESGNFEWGKERIYFDIKLDDLDRFRDLVIKIASQNKIPLAFKYIDIVKSYKSSLDGSETRFVTNFATADDALSFFKLVSQDPDYKSFQSDRNMSYNGYRVDEIAEYSNGYRETRDSLRRIVETGSFNPEGKWQWSPEPGRLLKIDKDQYDKFKKQLDELDRKIEETKTKWENILEDDNN